MPPRARRIASVLARRWLKGLSGARFGFCSGAQRRASFAEQARLACEDLGTTFIKIGQLISVRPDVFPSELVFELEKLQDSVPPLEYPAIREVVVGEFGQPPEDLYASFEAVPIASASIAQVHRAVLREEARPAWGEPLPAGSPVVVKIIRPGVEENIVADLEVARLYLARLKRTGLMRRVNADHLLDQIEASLHREMDMRVEARVADRFSFNFRRDPTIVIPRIAWKRTSRRVLTMEYIEGWPLSDLEAARRRGVDTRALAVHGAEAFMRQVLDHGLFHADLHHANLFATPDGRIAYLDFGIFGTLDGEERESVAQLLAALVYRDAERALRHSARLGVRIRPEKAEAMKRELGRLMDRTLGREGQGSADVKHFGMGFMALLHRFGVDIPVGYSLLVKALVTVEGVSRELYPDINIIETARPYVTRLLCRAFLRPQRLKARLPSVAGAVLREILS